MLKVIASTIALREGILQLDELRQRRQIFAQARKYADVSGKPLLVIGTPKFNAFNHPYGDVTLDIDERKVGQGNTELGDIRDIQYPDGYFGAAYCSHVLEHLPTVDDAVQSIDELERVADKVFTVSPHRTSLMAQLYSDHHLWITPSGDGYIIEQRGSAAPATRSYVISMRVYQPIKSGGKISQIDIPGTFSTAVITGVGFGLGILLLNQAFKPTISRG